MKIQNTLREYIITEGLDEQVPEGFDDNYDLIDSGTIDSLFIMNLVIYLEQEHNVIFGMNDIVPENFKSVNTLSAFVSSNKPVTIAPCA